MNKMYYSELQKTEYAPRMGRPLWNVLSVMQDKMLEAEKLSYIESTHESKLFGYVFYSNVIRKEFANERVRSALVTLSQTKYYKQKVKQHAKNVQRKIAAWDSEIALALQSNESNLERYDLLSEVTNEDMGYLFTPFKFTTMQVLTANGYKESGLIADLVCSMALLEYANNQLCKDVGSKIMECPALEKLSAMYAESTQKALQKVIDELNKVINPKLPDVNINEDKNVCLAADNLFNNLQSFNRMREIISKTFEMGEEEEKQNLNEAELQNQEMRNC